jgi:hypothetical protein
MVPVVFDNDDRRYLAWVASHPKGYVVNTLRGYSPHYLLLHRACCHSINKLRPPARPGGFTERALVKICADTVEALRQWCKQHGSAIGSFSKRCPICKP